MKFEEIENKFSATLAKLFTEGYTVFTGGMTGYQGEIAKVALKKDGKFYCLVIDRFYNDFEDDNSLFTDGIEGVKIMFGEAHKGYDPRNTLWIDKLQMIFEERFYTLGRSHFNCNSYGTREEAIKARQIRRSRISLRRSRDWLNVSGGCKCHDMLSNDKAVAFAKKLVSRRLKGYKKNPFTITNLEIRTYFEGQGVTAWSYVDITVMREGRESEAFKFNIFGK